MDYCRIYVVAHKKFDMPKNQLYVPIQVGDGEDLFAFNGVRDNAGDNIAEKNANYCELTAIYWIWKNIKDITNVGICHYRRYFTKHFWRKNEKFYLTEKQIKTILNHYDIILPKPLHINRNVEMFYYIDGCGKKKDLEKIKKIIYQYYPDYANSLEHVLSSDKASYCNMMVMPFDKFNNYCNWLFRILFELEKSTDLSGYSKAEARIYGYLSEILLNVWVEKNNLKVKYVTVVNSEFSTRQKIKKICLYLIRVSINSLRKHKLLK